MAITIVPSYRDRAWIVSLTRSGFLSPDAQSCGGWQPSESGKDNIAERLATVGVTSATMTKGTVYPSSRWDITRHKDMRSPKLCTRAYYDLPTHSQQTPDYTRPIEVEETLLDGDGCVLRSKLC